MKKTLLFFVAATTLLFASSCGEKAEKATETTETTQEETAVVEEEPEVNFGKEIGAENAISMDQFSSMMEGKDTVEVKLAAIAADVCQNKGCWMKVQTADGKMMRIKFKDYGFFVPKDITGKNIVFEGIAFRDTVSVEDLKHYAEDGGESEEAIAAITEPEINTSFLAEGVLIVE